MVAGIGAGADIEAVDEEVMDSADGTLAAATAAEVIEALNYPELQFRGPTRWTVLKGSWAILVNTAAYEALQASGTELPTWVDPLM